MFCAGLALGLPTSPHPLQNGGLSPCLHRASVHQALSALLRLGMPLLLRSSLRGQQAVPALSSGSLHKGSRPALAHSHLSGTQGKKKEHTH